MNDKTRLVVFSRKEVFLIFVFVFLIAVTSFIFGVRIGKRYAYTEIDKFSNEDKKTVELMSNKEEEVKQIEGSDVKVDEKKVLDDTYDKLKEEFKKIDEGTGTKTPTTEGNKPVEKNVEMVNVEENQQKLSVAVDETEKHVEASSEQVTEVDKASVKGKFTIQLGSYRSKQEAEQFANGFKIRGYTPIIYEAAVKERGVWYRVNLGAFNSIKDAKEYVAKEKTLFSGTDYMFTSFE